MEARRMKPGRKWWLWSVAGLVVLTVLLLRVSGVRLMERDIGKRRPRYADYVLKTNAFFPGLRRK